MRNFYNEIQNCKTDSEVKNFFNNVIRIGIDEIKKLSSEEAYQLFYILNNPFEFNFKQSWAIRAGKVVEFASPKELNLVELETLKLNVKQSFNPYIEKLVLNLPGGASIGFIKECINFDIASATSKKEALRSGNPSAVAEDMVVLGLKNSDANVLSQDYNLGLILNNSKHLERSLFTLISDNEYRARFPKISSIIASRLNKKHLLQIVSDETSRRIKTSKFLDSLLNLSRNENLNIHLKHAKLFYLVENGAIQETSTQALGRRYDIFKSVDEVINTLTFNPLYESKKWKSEEERLDYYFYIFDILQIIKDANRQDIIRKIYRSDKLKSMYFINRAKFNWPTLELDKSEFSKLSKRNLITYLAEIKERESIEKLITKQENDSKANELVKNLDALEIFKMAVALHGTPLKDKYINALLWLEDAGRLTDLTIKYISLSKKFGYDWSKELPIRWIASVVAKSDDVASMKKFLKFVPSKVEVAETLVVKEVETFTVGDYNEFIDYEIPKLGKDKIYCDLYDENALKEAISRQSKKSGLKDDEV